MAAINQRMTQLPNLDIQKTRLAASFPIAEETTGVLFGLSRKATEEDMSEEYERRERTAERKIEGQATLLDNPEEIAHGTLALMRR